MTKNIYSSSTRSTALSIPRFIRSPARKESSLAMHQSKFKPCRTSVALTRRPSGYANPDSALPLGGGRGTYPGSRQCRLAEVLPDVWLRYTETSSCLRSILPAAYGTADFVARSQAHSPCMCSDSVDVIYAAMPAQLHSSATSTGGSFYVASEKLNPNTCALHTCGQAAEENADFILVKADGGLSRPKQCQPD